MNHTFNQLILFCLATTILCSCSFLDIGKKGSLIHSGENCKKINLFGHSLHYKSSKQSKDDEIQSISNLQFSVAVPEIVKNPLYKFEFNSKETHLEANGERSLLREDTVLQEQEVLGDSILNKKQIDKSPSAVLKRNVKALLIGLLAVPFMYFGLEFLGIGYFIVAIFFFALSIFLFLRSMIISRKLSFATVYFTLLFTSLILMSISRLNDLILYGVIF